MKNQKSFRVVRDAWHLRFLARVGGLYSTSANPSGRGFALEWARSVSDICVLDRRELRENTPSRIYRVSRTRLKKIR